MFEHKLLRQLDYYVIDTETTGGSPTQDKIIEIAVIHWRDGIIYDRFSTLVNPGIRIPAWITALTGIDDSMVDAAPAFSEIAKPLRELLDKGIFAAHNAPFDFGFIQGEFARLNENFIRPQICTLKLARRLLPHLKSRSLGALCEHLLIDVYDRHRAFGDAEATVYVLKNLLHKLESERRISTWGELQAFFSLSHRSSLVPRP